MPPPRSSAWRRSAVILGLVFGSLFPCAAAADCAPSPISVPVGNVTLSTGNVRRGVEAAVGTPSQQFAFMPGWYTSNTYLYGTDGRCESSDWSASTCTTFRGGAYDSSASKTKKTASENAISPDPSPYNAMTYVTDTLRLDDDTSLLDFPMGVAINDLGTQGYYPQMTLGLATNSTLLNALKVSGKIASRTYSFFAGKFGATSSAQMSGAMAFGGYDKAKVTGKKYTTPLTLGSSCSTNMVVTITDIQLNFPNGTNASIFDGSRSSSITACISPSLPVFMNLPLNPYFSKWLKLSNSSLDVFDLGRSVGLNFWNMRYYPGYTPYKGDVTLKFLSGLSVRLPNELLIVPELDIDSTSGAIVTNASGPNFLINSGQDVNANDMAALGTTFLSAAYLMVNQDAGQFTLWAADPSSTKSELVAVDAAGADVTSFCAASTASETATLSSSSPGPSGSGGTSGSGQSPSPDAGSMDASSAGSGLSKGSIAGLAVGGVAAVVLLSAAVFWFLRKRRRVAAAAAAAAAAATAAAAGAAENGGDTQYHEADLKSVYEADTKPFTAAEVPTSPWLYYNPPAQSPGVTHELA